MHVTLIIFALFFFFLAHSRTLHSMTVNERLEQSCFDGLGLGMFEYKSLLFVFLVDRGVSTKLKTFVKTQSRGCLPSPRKEMFFCL